MKPLLRTRPLLALTVASALFVACSREKAAAPAPADPVPAFTMNSYFGYVTITPAGGVAHSGYGTGYSPREVKGTAALAPQALVLDFVAGLDNAHFEVDRAALAADWTGTYVLRCRNRATAPVLSSYVYNVGNVGGLSAEYYRFSDTVRELPGNVTITAYDAQRQLVSGTYTVQAPDQDEPGKAPSANAPQCTILLDGTFQNLKVTPH